MKVGKKALSCLLAIIMIVSSCSVCFSVLGATTDTADIYSAIVMHYDSLMDAIDKATVADESKRDTSGVPVKDGSEWVVERDTLNGGWLAVSRAIAQYAKGTFATNKTYVDLVEKIKSDAAGYAGSNGHPVADYNAILDYYKFGSNATGHFTSQDIVTLNIGIGFDLLAFKDVASIQDKTYSKAILKFTPKKDTETTYILSSADDISFTTEDFIEAGTDVAVIKGVLEQCIDQNAFKAWFGQTTLTTDQLAEMTNLLALYDTTMALAGLGYTEAEIWDHFVAPVAGKTYTETKAWYDNAGARAEAEPRAEGYKTRLEALMNTPLDDMTAFELNTHKQSVVAVINEMDNDQFSVLVYQIINEEENFVGKNGYIVETYLKELGVKIGQAYATVVLDGALINQAGTTFTLADKLAELATTVDSLKTKNDVELAEGQAWEETPEYQANLDWLEVASEVVGLIDNYVLSGATFADLVDCVTDSGNAITEELYNKVAGKVGTLSLEIYGSTYREDKAAMDSIIAKTILTGRSYGAIYEIAEEFIGYYNKALNLKNTVSMQAVYESIYPNGLDEYEAYIHTLKAAAAQAYFDAISIVDAYISEAGKVAYYNFEVIISKAEAVSSSDGTYPVVATFLESAPAYVPVEDEVKLAQLSNLYNKIYASGGYLDKANAFKTGLNNLRNLAYTNAENNQVVDKKLLAYILKQENVSGSAYAWESMLGNVSVDKIREFVNEVELVNGAGVATTDGNKITTGGIEDLMSAAVEDLDKILISNDLGTLLNSLTAKENEETGATVGFLGVWGFDYTFKNPDGGTTTVKAGDPCKNLREFLINLVVGLLWGGSLQTMLFSEVAGKTVGGAVYNLAGNPTDLSILGKKDNWQWLPELLHMGLPTMPHDYLQNWTNPITGDTNTEVSKISDYYVDWSKFFTGEAYGAKGHAEYDYTDILHVLDKAPFDTKFSTSGTEARTYWAPFTYAGPNSDTSKQISNGERDEYYPGDQVTADKALDARYWGKVDGVQLPIYYENASGARRATAASGYEPVYFDSKAAWHINDWDDCYRTFATATCGLHVPLAELLSHKNSTGSGSNIYGEADILNLDATVNLNNTGDSLYDRLFIPLYRLLGIEGFYNANTNPGGYHGKEDILNACQTWAHGNNMGVDSSSIKDSGFTLWKYVLEPIVYWLENTLFVSPVKTIAELLPNLLTMLEYDQLMPKLRNIKAHIKATVKPVGITVNIDVLTLNLSDIVVPLLEGLGLTEDALKSGINGLLGALIGGTRTTSKPNMDTTTDKWLMQVTKVTEEDEFGNMVTTNKTSETEPAAWKASDGNTYYIKNPGLLTATLYGLMINEDDPATTENETLENAFLDWIFLNGGTVAQIPLQIPVNRFMATGSLKGGDHPNTESTTIAGVYSSVTNYHIYAEAGTAMLVLLRWLLNDGTLNSIMPLLSGLIKPTKNADGTETSILDTIVPIIDGQADNLMAVIICLLNDYVIDFEAFQDPAQDTDDWGKWNAEGTEFTPYLDENGNSQFQFGTVFQKYLAEGNADVTADELAAGYGNGFTDADLTAKADLAVANVDKTIAKLVPTLFVALKDTLLGVDAIRDLGFEAVIEKAEKAIDEENLDAVTLETVVADTVIGNDLVDMIMNLVFGNGLPTKAKDAAGKEIQAHTDGETMTQTYTDGKGNTTTTTYYITAGSETAPLAYDANGDVEIVRQVKYALDADGNETDTIEGFVVNEGLLGGLFADPESILNKVLGALGDFNLDISPAGFYSIWIDGTTSGKNTQLAAWLESQAYEHFYANGGTGSGFSQNTIYEYLRDNMTWGDIRAPKGTAWFDENTNDMNEKFDRFGEMLCDLLYPLNPILAFLLSGQDIVLFDELKIQGDNGYSKGIVAILEALMLDTACMSQNSFDNYVYTADANTSPEGYVNNADVNIDNLSSGTIVKDGETITKRFATTKNSPLKPLIVAIKQLLIGNATEPGLLDAPLTVLFTRLPNIAYNLYLFKGENGKNTCNFSIAVKNLISPVTKVLDIVDPILSRLINLNINELLDEFLDIEALINNLINGLAGLDEGTGSSVAIFDFGKLAADSSTVNLNATTYRHGMTKFTKFEGSPGKFFITLIRTLLTKDVVGAIGGLVKGIFNKDDSDPEANQRVEDIIKMVETNLCRPDTENELQGGAYIDYLSSIIIDIFTDYLPDEGELYFYEIINRIDDELVTLQNQIDAMSDDKYGIKHDGYDWENKPKDENGNLLFTEAKVNETIENLDYVIRKAVPEVLATLQSNGVIGDDVAEMAGDSGLWGLLQGLVKNYVFKDDSMTWVAKR